MYLWMWVWILKVERVSGSRRAGERILYKLESTVNNVGRLWEGSAVHVKHEHNEIKRLMAFVFPVWYRILLWHLAVKEN